MRKVCVAAATTGYDCPNVFPSGKLKLSKLLPLFWQFAEFLSTRRHKTPTAYFQTILSSKTQTSVHLQHRLFIRKEEGKPSGCLCFQNNDTS